MRQGLRFDKAKLQRILANVTYTGQVLHKGEILPGEHSPIIDLPVFEKVQRLIKANFRIGTKPTVHFHDALLKKLLRCGNCGAIMAHTYGKKKNRLYHYYVCTTKEKQGREVCDTRRLPAQEIEDCVAQLIMRIGQDPKLTEQAFRESVKQNVIRGQSLSIKITVAPSYSSAVTELRHARHVAVEFNTVVRSLRSEKAALLTPACCTFLRVLQDAASSCRASCAS